MTQSANPLKQFFRQPAIYMRLPSQGNYWPTGAVVIPTAQELPVYPMTAIDEITYRTPDALFNGQSVVTVIQSCIPSIKDAWATPSTDINSILTAIRIASFGHEMEVNSTCPKCNTSEEYTVDLRQVLDQTEAADFSTPMEFGDLTITFQPMNYRSQTDSNIAQFEQQKNIQYIQLSTELTDQEKINKLSEALATITQLTVSALKWSIASIKTPQALVTEPEFIEEFLNQCDRKVFNQLRDHIIELRQKGELKPMSVECSSCGHKYKQSVALDQSNFFDSAS